jgi:hypothetical protein
LRLWGFGPLVPNLLELRAEAITIQYNVTYAECCGVRAREHGVLVRATGTRTILRPSGNSSRATRSRSIAKDAALFSDQAASSQGSVTNPPMMFTFAPSADSSSGWWFHRSASCARSCLDPVVPVARKAAEKVEASLVAAKDPRQYHRAPAPLAMKLLGNTGALTARGRRF